MRSTARLARRFVPATGVGAVLLAVAACGTTTSPSSSPTPAGTAEAVTARDFSFDRTSISASPGEMVTVTIKNTGAAEHSFTVDSLNASVDADPGASKTVTFALPQSGPVAYKCKYHPTSMHGNFIIGTGAGNTSASSVPGSATASASASAVATATPTTAVPTATTNNSAGGYYP